MIFRDKIHAFREGYKAGGIILLKRIIQCT